MVNKLLTACSAIRPKDARFNYHFIPYENEMVVVSNIFIKMYTYAKPLITEFRLMHNKFLIPSIKICDNFRLVRLFLTRQTLGYIGNSRQIFQPLLVWF